MSQDSRQYVLLFACEDRKGIVAAVANSLVSQDCNIVENAQHGDATTGRFIMRVKFVAPGRMMCDAFARSLRPGRDGVADLIILARYMQVLSDTLCRQLDGRVINIHHSFLPGFKGANPYHRAHDRGVKMVAATAHYVTPDLDEGPIIAQDVSIVDHADSVDDLIAQGQDTESRVLGRAVQAHLEHRVLLSGNRTIVFR